MRVAHIVPSMFIGGVEIAIQRSFGALNHAFDYRVFWVKRRGTLPVEVRHVWRLLWSSLTSQWRPDIVVTSLWYAHPFGRLLRLFGIPWVAFFHNSGFSNPVDRVVQRWAWRRAGTLFVDSAATLTAMQRFGDRTAIAIPYIFETTDQREATERDIGLIWIGRAVPAKRIDLFVELTRRVRALDPEMRCIAIVAGAGADGLDLSDAEGDLGLEVLRNQTNEQVRELLGRSRFFALTSDYEGMSMTTIEAVQSGCVPVVRLVGEIGRYLDHSCAVLMADGSPQALEAAAHRVHALQADAQERRRIAALARQNVDGLGTYIDAFATGLKTLLERPEP